MIKQGSFSGKGMARGKGDAALTGDPLVNCKGSSCQVKTLLGVVRGDLKLYFIWRFENVVLVVCIFFPTLYFLL